MVAAAMIGSAVVGGVASASAAKSNAKAAQAGATSKNELDPRAQAIIYGDGTDANKGLLAQYQGYMNQAQSPGTAGFGAQTQNFLGNYGNDIMGNIGKAAGNLTAGQGPQSANVGYMHSANVTGTPAYQAAEVKAPGQNNLDLTGAYDKFINGDAGANPYLTNALKAGVEQTNTSFQKNQTDLTNNLQRNILPGISSNAVLAGQYGGTRQGIAQGNAISDFTNQLNSSNTALAQANSANTLGAQAQSYNQGQDRALAAMQGLSAQQYGAASQNAAAQNASSSQANAGLIAANAQNAGAYNAASQFNLSNQQQNNQFNAGLNQSGQVAGISGSQSLLNNAYGYATNQDNAGINRAAQVNGLLSPYLSLGGSSTSSSPVYQNTAGNILGGAAAGLGLYNQFQQTGSNNTTTPNAQNITPWSG